MTNRTTERVVTFQHPFFLTAIGADQAAGTYMIVTEEELLMETSFPVYRRIATRIFLHDAKDDRITGIATIDPKDLEDALRKDAQPAA